MLPDRSLTVARMPFPERSHNAAIDGLRALAVLAVIAFHANAAWLPGGFTGVDLFFVVSGFVISQSLASRANLSLGTLLLDFYRRRVLRLLPALLVMLMATFVLSALFIPRAWRNEQFDQTGWAALVGFSNIVLAGQQDDYFSPGAELNPFLHTWTLGVEEQFYLVFPLLFFVWLRGRERWPWSRWLLPALTVLSLAWATWRAQAAPAAAFYLLPSRFWELAAGALLYQWMSTRSPGKRGDTLALSGLALLLVGVLVAPQLAMPVPGVLATVIGTLLLLAVVAGQGESRVARALGWAPLSYLGRLSYSLYLWHWPLLVLLRWTWGPQGAALWLYPVLLLAVSAASYHCVERPLRSAAPLLRLAPARVLAMVLPVVALCGAGAWATVEYHEQISLSVTRDGYAWQARRYPAWRPLEPVSAPALEGRRLFVVGDSHAAAYRTMTSMAARQTGMEIRQEDRGGCSFVNLLGPSPAGCQDFIEESLSSIEREARAGDIVLLAALRMPELRGFDWQHHGEQQIYRELLAERTPARAQAAREEAERVLRRLQRLGVHVVIDAPLPLFKAGAYRCSDWFNRSNPACAGGLDMPRADLQRLRAPQMALLAELAARYPSLTVWDPLPLLCGPDTCSAVQDGEPLFFDNDHLSGHGNRVLLPSFRQLLIDLAGDGATGAPPPT
ncbi:acyltransferase family protein [Stenotrophomonas sp. HMWF023]|uniref:acyltransferase family protein n=1 Tax=Stenotrophomonas sp. HMWF023 TaxID=2056859 RepID=UPI000D38CC49|nr:acyltransferase family protein [Stenotrophomonas sp. HMWF023]PTS81197.1 acyltransferase [Stenotrophomonas sp. HMWF023]